MSLNKKKTFIYLGLHINDQLKWDAHIDSVCKKINPYIYVLYSLNDLVSRTILYKIYYAHIHSRIIYMNCLWSAAQQHKLNKLQVLQNKAIKAIHALPRLTSSSLLYSENLLPIDKLGRYEIILTIHKMKFNLIRINIDTQTNQDVHDHATRNSDHLHLPLVRTACGRRGIIFNGYTLYNGLPLRIKTIASLITFKKELKKYLFDESI